MSPEDEAARAREAALAKKVIDASEEYVQMAIDFFQKKFPDTDDQGEFPTFAASCGIGVLDSLFRYAHDSLGPENAQEFVRRTLAMLQDNMRQTYPTVRLAVQFLKPGAPGLTPEQSFRGMLERKVAEVGRNLKDELPPGVGFSLMLWSLGDKGWTSWVSSCRREDMIPALREMADTLEKEAKNGK